jgi:hypothetical protein
MLKNVSTGSTKATTAPRSASSSPSRSTEEEEKLPGLPMLRNGLKNDSSNMSESIIKEANTIPYNTSFGAQPFSIGGDVIGQSTNKSVGSNSTAAGFGALDSHSEPLLSIPNLGVSGSHIGSLGGLPIQMSDNRLGSKAPPLSSSLGGDVFNGRLSNDYHHQKQAGGNNDKWNFSDTVGGAPLMPLAGINPPSSEIGGTRLNTSGGMWHAGPTPSTPSGVIGGQRFNMNSSNACSSSALASILGINLPTGSGSLNSFLQPLSGPSPISTLNSSSISTNPVSISSMSNYGGLGEGNRTLIHGGGTSSIGGIPIGGAMNGGYQGHGTIGGGSKNNDIALLRSLLPGVHITSDSNNNHINNSHNTMMDYNSSMGGWNLNAGSNQHGLGPQNGGGGGVIGGEPIRTNSNWINSGLNLSENRSAPIGAVGHQQHTVQNHRQQGPGIW